MYASLHVLVLNNISAIRQALKDERFSETGREINKDIVASKRLSQIPVVREDCQIVRTAFHRFKRLSVIAAGGRVYVV